MFSKLFVPACLAVVLSGCASPRPNPKVAQQDGELTALSGWTIAEEKRIVGGRKALPGELPWQVALRVQKSTGEYLCGGVVIKPGWVLTAAHCVEDAYADGASAEEPARVEPEDVQARSGSTYLEKGGLVKVVSEIMVMPDRVTRTKEFDLALLRVRTDATATPIELSGAIAHPESDAMPVGTKLLVSGFGRTGSAQTPSAVLKVASVDYIERVDCNGEESHNGRVTNSMICAGLQVDGTGSCVGDSGGPLVRAGDAATGRPARLVGIVSWGLSRCAIAEFPGVYANVSHPRVARWIGETLAADSASTKNASPVGGFGK